MTNNEKILKRALEMAAKHIFGQTLMGGLGQSCIGCPVKQPCFTDMKPCVPVLYAHFIRKAKEAICKGN